MDHQHPKVSTYKESASSDDLDAPVAPVAPSPALPIGTVHGQSSDAEEASELAGPESSLFEVLYDREWRRRDHLQSAISTPFALVSALAGGVFYVLQHGIGRPATTVGSVAGIALILATATLVISVGALLRSFVGHSYSSIPRATALREYRNKLRTFHSGGSAGTSAADDAFAQEVARRYAVAASVNHDVNNRRADWLHRSNIAMVATLPLLGIAAATVAIKFDAAATPITQVQIVPTKPLEVRIMADPKQVPAPQQPATTNEHKPVLPPNHTIKGGTDIPAGGKTRGSSGSGGTGRG